MLIDAGIGPRVAAKRMEGTGVSLRDVRAICLTHLDGDHFRGVWSGTIAANRIALFCHEARRYDAERMSRDTNAPESGPEARRFARTFNGDAFELLEGVRVTPIPLAHDTRGSHGFLFEGFGTRIGYASDLGHVPRDLLERFVGLDVLALESNYDPQMELSSSRPEFLKHRIMGGRGHLSNVQAFDAIRAILDRCQRARKRLPAHIVLLHRSRQCNCPRLMRELFGRDTRIVPRLVVADQFHRTEWLRPPRPRPHAGEQLLLAF